MNDHIPMSDFSVFHLSAIVVVTAFCIYSSTTIVKQQLQLQQQQLLIDDVYLAMAETSFFNLQKEKLLVLVHMYKKINKRQYHRMYGKYSDTNSQQIWLDFRFYNQRKLLLQNQNET